MNAQDAKTIPASLTYDENKTSSKELIFAAFRADYDVLVMCLATPYSLPSYFIRSFPSSFFAFLPLFSQLLIPCFLVLSAQLGFPKT